MVNESILIFVVFSPSHRQCALVALQDVKAYLTKEGGQIAVSPLAASRSICHSVRVCLDAASFQKL